MSNGHFGLADGEFWSDPRKTELQTLDAAMETGEDALVLDLPHDVSLSQRSTIPFGVLYVRSLAEDAALDAKEAMVLVASRHHDRAFFSGFAFRVDRRRPPADSRPEPGAGFTGSVYRSEVVEKLGVPWERGTYSVRALIREKASNVCSCTLGSSGADFRDDPLETYIEERRRNRAATVESVWPPLPTIRGAITRALEGGVDPFPNYKQRSDSPALPDEDKEGLELSVDRVAELGGGRRCLLRGAFRLHVRPDERVPFDPETGRLVDVGVAGTTAMVLVHLVVTSAGDDGFTEISLRLPTSDPVPPEGGLATGYFNLDLFSLPGFRLVSDTYFISAFSGEHVRGPIPVGIAPRMD